MIYLRLFFAFCRVGLFSVGGGLSTIPFLADLGRRTGWFTDGQMADMIAVSESTPGPMGINMATYAGSAAAGTAAGGVIATLGLICPSVVIVLMISRFLGKFRQSKTVDAVFYGLRAASVALITSAALQVARVALLRSAPTGGGAVYWPAALLAGAVFVCARFTPLKRLHPVLFIALSAAAGIVFRM